MALQRTVEKVLRPPWNFEYDYDLKTGDWPILFTWPSNASPGTMGGGSPTDPDYSVLDPEARLPNPPVGISPTLAKFVTATLGSTLLAFIPIVPVPESQSGTSFVYLWRFVFRQRSLADSNRNRKQRPVPYSVSKSSYGTRDTRSKAVPARPNLTIGGPRYVIPASVESLIFGRDEQHALGSEGQGLSSSLNRPMPAPSDLLPEAVSIGTYGGLTANTAIYPGTGSGEYSVPIGMDYQQGILDPANFTRSQFNATAPTCLPKFVRCLGDEYAIEVFKYVYAPQDNRMIITTPDKWNFLANGEIDPSTPDYNFSVMFGSALRSAQALAAGQLPPTNVGVRVVGGLF